MSLFVSVLDIRGLTMSWDVTIEILGVYLQLAVRNWYSVMLFKLRLKNGYRDMREQKEELLLVDKTERM